MEVHVDQTSDAALEQSLDDELVGGTHQILAERLASVGRQRVEILLYE
jgi:hypothetical protein